MNRKKVVKNLRKPPPLATSTTNNEQANDEFEIELYWCVQQLENSLDSTKLSQKLAEDTAKHIKVLKSTSAPLVKKRQVMKAALGDYRTKMRDEEKSMRLASKQIKFTHNTVADVSRKGSFVKKSAILMSGTDFRFNFAPPMDNSDTAKICSEIKDSQASNVNKPVTCTSGSGFKFNFAIDEANTEFNLHKLSIK